MGIRWQILPGCMAVCGTLAFGSTMVSAQDMRMARPAQISLGFNLTLSAAEMGDQNRLMASEGLRKLFYEMMSRECDVLLATIASSCQLTNASINIHEQRHGQPTPYVQLNGNGSFQVMLKGK
jgi:hypothetical protein